MTTTNSFVGQIDLLALVDAKMLQVGDQDCVVIPVGTNPSIFMTHTKAGQQKALLDIFIRETSNSQYGNTHFVKANVGRNNREKLGIKKEELARYSPIIGNIKPFESASRQANPEVQDDDDLPPDTFKGF